VWWCGIIQRPRHTSRRSQKVIKFLENCGEPNLQFLVRPKTIRRALRVLDVSGDGEIDIDEWRVRQRLFPRATIHSAPNAGRRPSTAASRSASKI
jgi:hypothetical protein